MNPPLPPSSPPKNCWRILRRCLVALAICATLIGLYYTEELWRGKRAWENCKRGLEANGIDFNWADHIPASVPDSENVFGVPEMQRWFTGRGATELSKKMAYPGLATATTRRVAIAKLEIKLPGADSVSGSNVLHWGDPRARDQATRLIKDALGPVALHPSTPNLVFVRSSEEVRPARIVLECQTTPSTNNLLQFLPKSSVITDSTDSDQLELDPVNNGYDVTMPQPDTAAEYLKWIGQFESEFSLISNALKRPYIRMNGDYAVSIHVPIPNFVTVRVVAQSLAAAAQCHLLLNKPADALADLTLMNDLSRIYTNRPITLVGAMINGAVAGLYVDTIADGMRWRAWREPQYAALEQQLQRINLIASVEESCGMQPIFSHEAMESIPVSELIKLTFAAPGTANTLGERQKVFLAEFIPRGWIYQNMVSVARFEVAAITNMDSANQLIFPDKVNAHNDDLHAITSRSSPYTFMAALWAPNWLRACQATATNQTKVNQALVVCALERYHLTHREYPNSLDALVPQFIPAIPHDVIGGQPPHYRREADGKFTLYSIGWTGLDGGGIPAKTADKGDWVWPDSAD